MKARVILVVMIIGAAVIAGQRWFGNADKDSAIAAQGVTIYTEYGKYEVAPGMSISVNTIDRIFSGR